MSSSRHSQARSWPVFRSLQAYRTSFLPHDLVAGLTLAAIAIPEQMATARLGGLAPEIGFFAFLGGTLGFAIFGESRFLSCGADSTIAPIFAGGLALVASAGSPQYAALAAALAVMVGVVLVAGRLFRLGWIADLLSLPVTTGFLAGIAVHIFTSQLPGLLGFAHSTASPVMAIAWNAAHLGAANPLTLAIGLGVVVLIAAGERINPRIPGALVGLIASTAVVMAFHLDAHGVKVIGSIEWRWPSFAMKFPREAAFVELMPQSLLIALVVMIQTAATTRGFPSDRASPPDIDRDFGGVGIGNIFAGLLGAFPVDASPPRTAIVAATGGRSQISGLFAVLVVIGLLVFAAGLLANVPEAALSGVLLFVSLRLVRIPQMIDIYRQSPGEFLLVIATWAAIVLMPIEEGVAIGIALSLLHGIWSVTRAHMIVFERVPNTSIWWPPTPRQRGETLSQVVVVAFQAPLSFLNAYTFRRDILAVLDDKPVRLVVLEASAILDIDFTAAQMLNALIRQCHDKKIVFAIARLESLRAQAALKRFGIDRTLGPDRLFRSVAEAIATLEPSAERAR